MWRLWLAALIVALSAGPAAQSSSQNRPLQADAVVRLLSDLESAIGSGRLADFRAIASPTITAPATAVFQRAIGNGSVANATIRERTRRPIDNGFEVLAEVLVSHGRDGRVATWLIATRPSRATPNRFEIADLVEAASVDGLLRLALDRTREFTVRNLTMEAPDLTLKMSSGSAFVAEDSGGITAIVLRGNGELRFAPQDLAEQGQLRLFAGHTVFSAPVDSALIRINSSEFEERISSHSLVPAAAVNPGNLARASALFDELSPKTYNLDLTDLSPDRWSLPPTIGSAVVEFKTRHFGWLTYVRAPGEAEDIAFFDRVHGHNISSYASAERLASRSRFYSEDTDVAYDVERYGVETKTYIRQYRSRIRLR